MNNPASELVSPGGPARHIVQLANFYGPRSGGLRTALHHLGAGYVAHGHRVTLVVPGRRRADEVLPGGMRRLTLPAPRIPGTGGYRMADPLRVKVLLSRLRPDRLEVSDRLTLRGMGSWAARHGVHSVVIAREEFDRIGAPNVRRVPLGVALCAFGPSKRDESLRDELAGGADTLVVHCGRLSPEKHVERSVDALAALHRAGNRVRLVVAGDGPRMAALRRRADGLPVTFLGFLSDRADVARPRGGRAPAFARAVRRLLSVPEPVRRAAARARAEEFDWPASVRGMLLAHD